MFIAVLALYNSDHSFSKSISWPFSIGGTLTLFSLDQTGSKVHPGKGHKGSEGEWRYISTLSLTSALDGVGDQRHAPAALPPGKTRYLLYRRLGGP